MATESVRQTPQLAEPDQAPMWEAILTNDAGPAQLLLRTTDPDRLQEIYKGAGNVLESIKYGLDAMQRMLWAALNPDPCRNELPSADDLSDLVHMQNVLSQLVSRLYNMQLNVTEAKAAKLEEDAAINAKAGTTIYCEGCEPYKTKSGQAVETALLIDNMDEAGRKAALRLLEAMRGSDRKKPETA